MMGILVQVQVTFGYRKSGVELGIWLKQGRKKSAGKDFINFKGSA